MIDWNWNWNWKVEHQLNFKKMNFYSLISFVTLILNVRAFVPSISTHGSFVKSADTWKLHAEGGNNPFSGLLDMFKNFDDVIDDFMDKKMGNGEVFYGKRKYRPGGDFEGDYEGYGLSDFRKIEGAKDLKAEALERMRQREEQQKSR